MRIIKAIVTSNSEDDKLMRVKVKSESIWPEESELLHSLNSVYLEKDDVVLVQFENLQDAIILGKFNNYEQKNPIEGQVLFSAKKDDSWIIGTYVNNEFKIESSKGLKIKGFYEDVELKTPDGSTFKFANNSFDLKLKNGASINSDGVKIAVKNNAASLFKILDQFLTDIQSPSLPLTLGSPTAQFLNPVVAAKFQVVQTLLQNLMK